MNHNGASTVLHENQTVDQVSCQQVLGLACIAHGVPDTSAGYIERLKPWGKHEHDEMRSSSVNRADADEGNRPAFVMAAQPVLDLAAAERKTCGRKAVECAWPGPDRPMSLHRDEFHFCRYPKLWFKEGQLGWKPWVIYTALCVEIESKDTPRELDIPPWAVWTSLIYHHVSVPVIRADCGTCFCNLQRRLLSPLFRSRSGIVEQTMQRQLE